MKPLLLMRIVGWDFFQTSDCVWACVRERVWRWAIAYVLAGMKTPWHRGASVSARWRRGAVHRPSPTRTAGSWKASASARRETRRNWSSAASARSSPRRRRQRRWNYCGAAAPPAATSHFAHDWACQRRRTRRFELLNPPRYSVSYVVAF